MKLKEMFSIIETGQAFIINNQIGEEKCVIGSWVYTNKNEVFENLYDCKIGSISTNEDDTLYIQIWENLL